MKAVQMMGARRPLELREIPRPEPGPGEVLVRIRAAGVCHSDAHYRAGRSGSLRPPVTLGHEIAGVVEALGSRAGSVAVGARVCLHYLRSCGNCYHCSAGHEQFCPGGSMLGHQTDGGYAEYIVVPERCAVPLPEEIPFEQGAILMCSSATALHALRKARLRAGESVAVFGVGGLGVSAVQLARCLGALDVYAVDIDAGRLALAERLGAVPIHAREVDPVSAIRGLTQGRGVDVALELIGLAQTMRQSVQSLGVLGRAVIAGLSSEPLELNTYREILGKEAELIGTNDHLLQELPLLLEFARRRRLDLSDAVTRTIPLEAEPINEALDRLELFGSGVRTVIVP